MKHLAGAVLTPPALLVLTYVLVLTVVPTVVVDRMLQTIVRVIR